MVMAAVAAAAVEVQRTGDDNGDMVAVRAVDLSPLSPKARTQLDTLRKLKAELQLKTERPLQAPMRAFGPDWTPKSDCNSRMPHSSGSPPAGLPPREKEREKKGAQPLRAAAATTVATATLAEGWATAAKGWAAAATATAAKGSAAAAEAAAKGSAAAAEAAAKGSAAAAAAAVAAAAKGSATVATATVATATVAEGWATAAKGWAGLDIPPVTDLAPSLLGYTPAPACGGAPAPARALWNSPVAQEVGLDGEVGPSSRRQSSAGASPQRREAKDALSRSFQVRKSVSQSEASSKVCVAYWPCRALVIPRYSRNLLTD